MSIVLPLCVISELPIDVPLVHNGIVFVVPVPETPLTAEMLAHLVADPVEIKKFIEDFAAKNKDTEDKAPAEPEPVKPKGKGGKQEKPKPTPKQNKNQAKAMTLKMLIQKTVPYSSAVYAEHAFR